MLNFDRMTQLAIDAINNGFNEAVLRGNPEVNEAHILFGILESEDNLFKDYLKQKGIDLNFFKDQVLKILDTFPKVSGSNQVVPSASLQKVFAIADNEAKKLGDSYVAIEHLLYGIAKDGYQVKQLLNNAGITYNELSSYYRKVRNGEKIDTMDSDRNLKVLESFTIDLTKLAYDKKLDPVIGREEEIRRIIQILSRRTKNNPVLIGEPGVGKTAIVEGVAQRIADGDVPQSLKGKKILSLDISGMLAGTKFRGEFEERMKKLLKAVEKAEGNIILFIDEIHLLIGAGKAEGTVDAANMLKPALARGQLHCIGATTLDEYRKYIEKDAALERRFQPLIVKEPDVQDTIAILRGIKERYELHHGIRITDKAVVAAATLSERYITDRFLPDKAIDLIDEAASRLRVQLESVPEIIDKKQRDLIRLEIEKQALVKETDEQSKQRLQKVESLIEKVKGEINNLKENWNQEKNVVANISKLKEQIESLKKEAEIAQRNGNFDKVAEIRYGKIPELEKQLEQLIEKSKKSQEFLKKEVDEDDIALIVSSWTGIPVTKLMESERNKLLNIEKELKKYVVGQDHALAVLAEAIRRNKAGLSDLTKPIGSFLFLGPTGVGKTETAKTLAKFLFDSEKSLIRLDMSEYMEKHSISKIIGAPPGYVGYDEGGSLTESVRRNPYSVILLDEIEKAHPDVFHLLLQILDDGRLTDSHGRVINFKNTIIIMTSNIGSDIILNHQGNIKEIEGKLHELLLQYFRPEFLNRIDEILIFNKLDSKVAKDIVNIQINLLNNRLKDKQNKIELTTKAIEKIVKEGFVKEYGARPLKRYIQSKIENNLAKMILKGDVVEKDVIVVDVNEKNEFTFKVKRG